VERSVLRAAGDGVTADHHFEGQRSTCLMRYSLRQVRSPPERFRRNGRVVHWVCEAFGHCKTIGAIGEGMFN